MDHVFVGISKTPEDPTERKQWAKSMARVQFAIWVSDGAVCAQCGKPYVSTNDMIDRNPRSGGYTDKGLVFIDSNCWEAWTKEHGHGPNRV